MHTFLVFFIIVDLNGYSFVSLTACVMMQFLHEAQLLSY